MSHNIAFADGQVVTLTDGHVTYVGTVTRTIGNLYNDTAVEVFWHNLGYTNWERPDTLALVSAR